ncbi:hypothetical protein DSECCO2_354260 [anaerobic digester metagenome]
MRYMKCLVLALLLASWGCAGTDLMGSGSQDPAAPKVQQSFFYDYNDIRVPEEMEIQTDKSNITPTADGKFGTMKFKGWAEPISLFDFFFHNMPKDGWTMVTYQKYQRFFLVFTKDNRVCMITIEETPLWYTWLEIKVSPKVGNTYSPAYSTGGQPMDTYPSSGSTGAPVEGERTLSQ